MQQNRLVGTCQNLEVNLDQQLFVKLAVCPVKKLTVLLDNNFVQEKMVPQHL